ncbi:hypothetical protein AWJ20_1549 [Sugiyamaella lignohabitans]|uniref:Uncharacterized protein n=1 Tax=Sugiyamaella lignohabitans TaxID=796027 RepID=A0A167DT51_9ASCO|nr:uncharacterized protein AWJ20_1549 [Sugiyamaella lignohabitans]ANB13265.1 hypothetical protein AWJ20_1549 [Sugiyamaella lignohabitans]
MMLDSDIRLQSRSSQGSSVFHQISVAESGGDRPIEALSQGSPEYEPPISKYNKYSVVIAGFIANFMVFGIAFTFGVFQDFYLSPEGPLHGQSVAVVSIIGSVATCLTYTLTICNNLLAKYLSVAQIMGIGSLIFSLGLICASFSRTTWEFSLTQGVLFGIGSSMLYMQPVIHGPPYFTTHRGIAMGIIFSGTGKYMPMSKYEIFARS